MCISVWQSIVSSPHTFSSLTGQERSPCLRNQSKLLRLVLINQEKCVSVENLLGVKTNVPFTRTEIRR